MRCGGSNNVHVSSFRHAERGTHASHISADNTIAVVSTIVNSITLWDLSTNKSDTCSDIKMTVAIQ